MARKETPDGTPQGLREVIGIVLIALSLLLFAALFSYDPKDVTANTSTPNLPPHNWIGPFGAWIASKLFFLFGTAAYFIPPVFLLFGAAQFVAPLAFLNRRWLWVLPLVLCFMGELDLLHRRFHWLETARRNVNAPSPGGFLGMSLNGSYAFGMFGHVGASIVFVTVYLISVLYLTNFQLFGWFATFYRRAMNPADPLGKWRATEEVLEKRAKDLSKQARKLQDEVEKEMPGKGGGKEADRSSERERVSGMGADGLPVPEPTVRDLSVPQPRITGLDSPAKSAETKAKAKVKETPKPEADEFVGEVIPAGEVAAATTADILGRKPAPKPAEPVSPAPADEAEETPEATPATAMAANAPAAPSAPAALPSRPKLLPRKPKPISVASTPVIGNYSYPPMDLLHFPDMTVKPTESKEELMANARLMQQTLAQFDIDVALGDITKGPTITRYELHPAPGVKLEKIAGLTNNIAAALKAERIHILAPVPGKSSVGVEVPNLVKTKVIMRDLLESEEWQKTKCRIPLALGKDVYGHPIIADLAEMPHLLIAGSTGSGKSVCINSIIASLLFKFSPDQLRFVMIDPKVVELQQYNALPHLVVPVVNDPKKVILALRWVVNEMEKRYQIFARVGVRNIKSFNERPKDKPPETKEKEPELPLTAKKEKIEAGADGFAVELDEEIVVPRDEDIIIPERLSYIVVIIDELADLMLVAPADVEMAIARITQMARAAGIHCIVATQRPSVDVITGVIKANIPARIAFQVAAKVDSRTILDAMGADKLLGKGDMLYLPPGSAKLNRAQGVLITDQEIQSIVDHISQQGKPSYEMEIHKQLQKPVASLDNDGGGSDEDESIIEQCIEVIRSEQKASVSLLQRRLRLGYGRAARIMDELENRGIVGPSKGAEPRDILIDLDGEGADGGGQQHGV